MWYRIQFNTSSFKFILEFHEMTNKTENVSNAHHAICGLTGSGLKWAAKVCRWRYSICQLHATNKMYKSKQIKNQREREREKIPRKQPYVCFLLLSFSIYRHLIKSIFCLIGYTMHSEHSTAHTYTTIASGLTHKRTSH